MKPSPRPHRLRAAMLLALAAGTAAAAPTVHVGSTVQIDFDPDTFVFNSAPGSGGSGVTLGATDFNVTTAADGISLSFGSNLYAAANSLFAFSPEDSFGSYFANINFTPLAGHLITGWRISLSGNYSIERPGEVSAYGPPGTYGFVASTGAFGAAWSHSESFAGATVPVLDGSVRASAFVDSIEIPGVLVGYEQMPDPGDLDCTGIFDDGICPTIDDPSRPIFDPPPRTETDFGDAYIRIETITLEATTAPVPEPQAWALMALGLGLLGWRGRRLQR